jgi:molybdopterin molybdotransferase
MISVIEARAKVLAGIRPLAAEMVGLDQALGRVLAADLAARVSHPPLAVSAMDGYALRAADLGVVPARLRLVGEAAAGKPFAGLVGVGQAVRIFTGAAVPQGADAVVMQEDTRREADEVVIEVQVPQGRHIRATGLDFSAGDVLLRAGQVLNARAIGLAAAMNIPWLALRRRPKVAVLSTGDEIAMPGDPLGPAMIVGSNGPGLCAMIRELGGDPLHLGIAADSRDSLDAMIRAARGCDLLVTTGGASVGDYDLVQDALRGAGMRLDFYKVAMRPGKPLMFGDLGGVPVLGLPGNPVSAMVCATLFLAPMMAALQGLEPGPAELSARLGRDVGPNDQREDYLRGSLHHDADGSLVATPFLQQDSAVISALAQADCLVIREPQAPAAKAGSTVRVVALRG